MVSDSDRSYLLRRNSALRIEPSGILLMTVRWVDDSLVSLVATILCPAIFI